MIYWTQQIFVFCLYSLNMSCTKYCLQNAAFRIHTVITYSEILRKWLWKPAMLPKQQFPLRNNTHFSKFTWSAIRSGFVVQKITSITRYELLSNHFFFFGSFYEPGNDLNFFLIRKPWSSYRFREKSDSNLGGCDLYFIIYFRRFRWSAEI